ncbi:MAG TPA: hypothetical protein VGR74_23990, partial [Actinomycetota bacterium]|nr:hypothetical protein [Actinomycetota bacterium]
MVLIAGCRFGGPEGAVDAATVAAAEAAAPDLPVFTLPDAGIAIDLAPPVDAAVCDPVHDTGYPALLRCDVGEGTLTGTCVGIWVTGEGAACFKGSGTDSCAVRLTCFGGTCRALCYRDTDCKAGACCNVSLPSGFKVCSACD